MKRYIIIAFSLLALSIQAQEVSTLYFLDNAPMRHTFNPAFQPVSNGYVNFTPLGYMSSWEGNNSLTLSDVLFPGGNGKTVTPLHPEYGNRQKFYNSFRNPTSLYMSNTINIVGFGFRIKEAGYFTFGAMMKIDGNTRLPKDLFGYLLDGGKASLTTPTTLNLSKFGSNTQVYTEIAGGYSHKINDIWTVGGKLKFLMGTAYVGAQHSDLSLTAQIDQMKFAGSGNILFAGPLNLASLPDNFNYETLQNYDLSKLLYDSKDIKSMILNYIKPSGYGAAIDLGFTAKPVKQLQISVAVNDLGFIYWNNGVKYNASADTTFAGVGTLEYSDYVYNEQFSPDSLWSDVQRRLIRLGSAYQFGSRENHFTRMVTTKLNVGIDGQFFDNRLDVGVLSKTMFYNGYISEEVTFGLAGKPWHWLNLAVTYSLLENGKYSNIGAGLSLMPYDGINMTLAMDYIPLYYAPIDNLYVLPSRSKGVNFALGFSIVWGTNKKKEKEPEPVLEYKPIQLEMDKPVVSSVALANVEAEKTQEIAKNDRDNDGVVDWEDECPDLAGPAFNKGCPEIKKELRTLLKKAMQGIQFETGKAVILPSSFAILNRIAVQFIEHPEYVIEVQGHTDNTGKYETNVDLSQHRAEAVREFLINAGVPDTQLTAKGYGPDRPIADNETKAGRAQNRRVEFDITFEQIQVQTIYEHADSVSVETLLVK